MTPDEERQKLLAELERADLEEQLAELDAADDVKRPVKRKKMGMLDKTMARVQAVGQGSIPFYDELVAGFSAAVTPGIEGGYRDYYDALKRQREQYQQESPGEAFAIEAAAGFNPYNPINKVGVVGNAPGFLNSVKGLARAVGRNATEAGIYGLGTGEGEGRTENMANYAATGGLLTAGMHTAGSTAGAVLDAVRLKGEMRPRVPVAPVEGRAQPDIVGDYIPLQIANPKSTRAGLVRSVLGRLPGANERLSEQQLPYILRARQDVADVEAIYDQQAENLDRHQWHRKNDIKLAGESQSAQTRAQIDQERLAAAQAQDDSTITATEAARRQAQETARLNQTLNLETLRASVPESRRNNITETGHAGFRQVDDEVNAAYAEAWGDAGDLAPGTVQSVLTQANAAAEGLDELSLRTMNRIIRDTERLGDGGSIAELDNAIRKARDSSSDFYLTRDLTAIRRTLREGMPEENRARLDAVDDVYPNKLAVQKATKAAAEARGVPTTGQVLTAAGSVGGERRTARGEQPLIDVIDNYLNPAAVNPPTAAPRRPRLERTISLEQRRAADAARVRADMDDAAVTSKAEKRRLKKAREAALAPVQAAQANVEKAGRLGSESPYMAYLLGGSLPGGFAGPKAGAVSLVGRALAGETPMLNFAGQGELQTKLAKALREGRTEYVTRAVARAASKLARKKDDEE